MIVVITPGPEGVGRRYELTDTAEILARLIAKNATEINAIREGEALFRIWPEVGNVEMLLTRMVMETVKGEDR